MSSSPVPPGSTSSSPVPSNTGSANGDWRGSVPQSSRNKKVREIASVLASLEPGASATSKLRLAMQFEDSMFKGAVSLEDYEKKLNKRLKKLKKNYVPTQPKATEKTRIIDQLREEHGEAIRYVNKNSRKAVKVMSAKEGEEKGRQLQQHLEGAKAWATALGLSETHREPDYNMADDQLERLRSNIVRRLGNLRAHVVKLADPDRFFVETLDKAEQDCKKGPGAKYLAQEMKRRYLHYIKSELNADAMMAAALEQTARPVPLPTKGATSKQEETAALHYLEKMRSASSAVLAFMAMKDEDRAKVPNGTLKKLHGIVTEGTDYVVDVIKAHRKRTKAPDVALADAWLKQLELPSTNNTSTPAADGGEPAPKRPRRSIALQSRILLRAGRKTPPILVPEFKRKGATLVRPAGEGSHLILNFENAFTMTIYMAPLLVELRAYNKKKDGNDEGKSSSSHNDHAECARWTPLQQGLAPEELITSQAGGDDDNKDPPLSVWNVQGDYETIGFVVQERLRDASAHATLVLRTYFGNVPESASNDFELEILEGQALRNFLQLVRNTYTPNWKDIV